jgi:hypothetical protein
MKKTYEKPVLTTEQFDVDDVITASAPDTQQPDTVGNNWQVPGLNLND